MSPEEARRGQVRPGKARRGQARQGEASRGLERPGKARKGQLNIVGEPQCENRPKNFPHCAADQRARVVYPPCTTRPPMKQQWFLLLTPRTPACSWTQLQKKAGRLSPPARCVTGVTDPQKKEPKWTPEFALPHKVFLLAGPIRGSILAPFFGSCGAHFLVTKMPKLGPKKSKKEAFWDRKIQSTGQKSKVAAPAQTGNFLTMLVHKT